MTVPRWAKDAEGTIRRDDGRYTIAMYNSAANVVYMLWRAHPLPVEAVRRSDAVARGDTPGRQSAVRELMRLAETIDRA